MRSSQQYNSPAKDNGDSVNQMDFSVPPPNYYNYAPPQEFYPTYMFSNAAPAHPAAYPPASKQNYSAGSTYTYTYAMSASQPGYAYVDSHYGSGSYGPVKHYSNSRTSYSYKHRDSSRSEYRSKPPSYDSQYNHSYTHSSRYERSRSSYRSQSSDYVREKSVGSSRKTEIPTNRSECDKQRDSLLKTWRRNYCETKEEIGRRLAELSEKENGCSESWLRSSPADQYYQRTANNEMVAKTLLLTTCSFFEEKLLKRAERVSAALPKYVPPQRKSWLHVCKHKSDATCSSSSEDSDNDYKAEHDCCMEELTLKTQHPQRLHTDLWHNEDGELNDGPLCRCSAKSRRIGIRHGIYPGEAAYKMCDPNSNNANSLQHYRITVSPPTNFLTKTPTMIYHDGHHFIFEGFSLLTHEPLGELPTCKVIRFNIEYEVKYVAEKMPENFTIQELDMFYKYLFHELLELVDFNMYPSCHSAENPSCPAFHLIPRFVRELPDNGKEVLAMSEVLTYLLSSATSVVSEDSLEELMEMDQDRWQYRMADPIKGMLLTKPGYKPCSLRVDQLDRHSSDIRECKVDGVRYPAIVHFGIRPPQLSYAGNPEYQKAWRAYVKYRHLMANMSKPSYEDKRKLEEKENKLHDMRAHGRMKRNVTVAISSRGFYCTGIMCDIVQHAMLIPVLAGHLRFHRSLGFLEESIGYKFKNRYLLQLALTHPSYKENYGTNPDHARNSLTNCGIRQPEYGDRKIHYANTRKRGINTLINIMSRFGKDCETMSNITHNERLEFLGDAVVEFLSSIHLFFLFPDLEEGGLATYRAAIVQNQHLALLAKKMHLEEYMLYAHGSDLCHELELRHAMANCFEALMGALLLDGGITVADNVFTKALFMEDDELRNTWINYPEHPLQSQEPIGDRVCIASYPVLQKLTQFEESIGVEFKHIRLLARAFTDRSIGFTHLTLGSNQRLEFLGDTVLQLICSEYLYRHFPEHHEGHLSLLRSSLVNNRTQAVVCDDLGMTKYAVYSNPKPEMKTKDRADLLEAFLGALYVDKGLLYCEQFCHVCLFPRLQLFIMNQDWNDPKSKLQQCCLTLRTMDGGEPDIPIYKVIESNGPTNTRLFTVAVYFRGKRLATASGSSIQQAEMNAAKKALSESNDLFPQLYHQKRVIAKSIQKQTGNEVDFDIDNVAKTRLRRRNEAKDFDDDDIQLPKQYRLREDISSDELTNSTDDESVKTQAAHKRDKRVEKDIAVLRKRESDTESVSPRRASCRAASPTEHGARAHSIDRISSDDSMDNIPDTKPKQAINVLEYLNDLVEDLSSDSDFDSN